MFFTNPTKRREQLSKLAFELDMQFHAKDEYGLKSRLGQFRLFKESGSKSISNLLLKKDAWLSSTVAIFDLKITDHDNSGEVFSQTVFFIDSKELSLPEFFIRPEYFFDRVGKFLKLADEIQFQEYPEFDKNYWIKGDEESLVKKMVSDDLARFFAVEKKWRLEGMNYFLIFYQRKKLLKPEEIKSFYKKGLQLFDWLKES